MLSFKGSPSAFEVDTDRYGSDFVHFDPKNSVTNCMKACQMDPRCLAWTYVQIGFAGGPTCYLKNPIPAPTANRCCSSGVKEPLELNFDRYGSDLNSFELTFPNPYDCQLACQGSPACRAWTYVNPGPGTNARCWLKNPIPAPTANNCCISGVKQ
jgi:hypothetical protein